MSVLAPARMRKVHAEGFTSLKEINSIHRPKSITVLAATAKGGVHMLTSYLVIHNH